MNRRFENRVAVVTGGSSGIGLAIAQRLLAEGASVAIGSRHHHSLDNAKRLLGPTVEAVQVDVKVEAQVEALIEATVRRFGRLDLGFNVAGLASFGRITELGEGDWDYTIDVCLKGVFLSVKHEARQMLAQGHVGAIVNVASLNCQIPMWGGTAYSCAKAGVEMLSRNAALELCESGIRVNTLSPGLTDTPASAPLKNLPGAFDAYFQRIPMRRAGTPEEMAAAALFLASDEATYITGSNLIVDGGWATTGYPDMRSILAQFSGSR